MNFIKSLIAFILSCVVLYLFYTYIHIPIIPCITFYIFMMLLGKLNCKNHKINLFFVILLSILSIGIYGFSVFSMIKYYPKYGNVVGIIFEIINVFTLIGTAITFSNAAKNAID